MQSLSLVCIMKHCQVQIQRLVQNLTVIKLSNYYVVELSTSQVKLIFTSQKKECIHPGMHTSWGKSLQWKKLLTNGIVIVTIHIRWKCKTSDLFSPRVMTFCQFGLDLKWHEMTKGAWADYKIVMRNSGKQASLHLCSNLQTRCQMEIVHLFKSFIFQFPCDVH